MRYRILISGGAVVACTAGSAGATTVIETIRDWSGAPTSTETPASRHRAAPVTPIGLLARGPPPAQAPPGSRPGGWHGDKCLDSK